MSDNLERYSYNGDELTFDDWKSRFIALVQMKECADPILYPEPNEPAEKKAWQKQNLKLHGYLIGCLDATNARLVVQHLQFDKKPNDGREAWRYLLKCVRGASPLEL